MTLSRLLPSVAALALLAACAAPAPVPPLPEVKPAAAAMAEPDRAALRSQARAFVETVATVEPVAEAECRRRAPQRNCDFRIVVDDTPGAPPNAFQTVDATGRPVIAFTVSLIGLAQNADEMAFVLSHEAAHHIAGHLDRVQQNATFGAAVVGQIVTALGETDPRAIRTAQEIGAAFGARTYSKDFELEADELGTVIAFMAGFDPVRGAAFFARIPDPGDRFLGTHPPNADRIATVLRTARAIGAAP